MSGSACFLSALRLGFIARFGKSDDPTYDYLQPSVWSFVEVAMAIICACMPTFRSLCSHFGCFGNIFARLSRRGRLPSSPAAGSHMDRTSALFRSSTHPSPLSVAESLEPLAPRGRTLAERIAKRSDASMDVELSIMSPVPAAHHTSRSHYLPAHDYGLGFSRVDELDGLGQQLSTAGTSRGPMQPFERPVRVAMPRSLSTPSETPAPPVNFMDVIMKLRNEEPQMYSPTSALTTTNRLPAQPVMCANPFTGATPSASPVVTFGMSNDSTASLSTIGTSGDNGGFYMTPPIARVHDRNSGNIRIIDDENYDNLDRVELAHPDRHRHRYRTGH